MRKIQVVSLALVAVFALSALTAASASAVTTLLALWLVGGIEVTSELLVEINGSLLLEDNKVPVIGKAAVLCSGTFDGWIGPNSLDWVSEVLNTAEEPISNTKLVGLALECTAQTGCETNTVVLVWPVGLPYETEVELIEPTSGPLFAVLFFPTQGTVLGYEISNCLVLSIAMEDECTSEKAAAELKLVGTKLFGVFSEASTLLAGEKLALCTQSKAETGIVEGEGEFLLLGGGEVSASSLNAAGGEEEA